MAVSVNGINSSPCWSAKPLSTGVALACASGEGTAEVLLEEVPADCPEELLLDPVTEEPGTRLDDPVVGVVVVAVALD